MPFTRRLEGRAHPPRRASRTILPILTLAAVLALVPPTRAADQIHWTLMGATAVTFDWRGPETTIEFGTLPGVFTRSVTAVEPDPLPDSSPGPFREARITGLAPNTIYHYRIGATVSTFRTPRPPGDSDFWIAAEADVGSSRTYRGVLPTQVQIAADNPLLPGDDRPEFVLVHGDLTYGDEHGPEDVDQHFNDVMVWSLWSAYMPTWGNHEWGSSRDDLQNYEGRFDLPNSQTSPNAPSSGGPGEDWYWFDYGNVRFVAWPEPYSGAWRDWGVKARPIMAEAQADDDITFIVAYGHRPPYSSGRDHGSNPSLAAILADLRDRYPKLVLTVSGHSHHYERTDPEETGGLVHVVNGIGGSTVGGLTSSQPSWSLVRRNHLGHVRIRFREDRIDGYGVCGPPASGATEACPPGTVFDRWTILAPDAAPDDTTGVEPIPAAAGEQVHWTITGPTSVTFDWAGEPRVIRFGRDTFTDSVTAVTPVPEPVSSEGPFWEARITGLEPDVEYRYQIGGGPIGTFRTPPPRGASGFTVAALGDVGAGRIFPAAPLVQQLVADADPRFALVLGDLTYGVERGPAAVEAHFNDVTAWSLDAAYMPAWGDHDVAVSSLDDPRNYEGRFDLPNPRTAVGAPDVGDPSEDWYWFDYGNARFIAYPEPFVSGDTWAAWEAEADALMAAVDDDPAIHFVVTFGHRPAWSSGRRDGSTTLQGVLGRLGARHPKYALNLSAHSRHYERTHPQDGVVHVVAGGGGAPLQSEDAACPWLGGCPAPEYSAFRALRHGPVILRFTADAIEGEALCGPLDPISDVTCVPGTALDTFRIPRRDGGGDGLGPELVGNPSFEADLEGWTPYMRAELERRSGGRTGERALRVVSEASGVFGAGDHPNWVAEVAGAGVRYRATAWIRSTTLDGAVRLRLREYDGGEHVASASSELVVPGSDWTLYTVELVTGRDDSYLDFQILAQPATAGAWFEVDDVSIRVVEPEANARRAATAALGRGVGDAPGSPAPESIAPRFVPNPALGGRTSLELATTAAGPLRVELFDVAGRWIATVRDEPRLAAGRHVVAIDRPGGAMLEPGLYFGVVRSARGRETVRLTVVR